MSGDINIKWGKSNPSDSGFHLKINKKSSWFMMTLIYIYILSNLGESQIL